MVIYFNTYILNYLKYWLYSGVISFWIISFSTCKAIVSLVKAKALIALENQLYQEVFS